MDKTAVAHWAPEIGGQFWWNGVFFVLIFVPFMLFIGRNYLLSNVIISCMEWGPIS